MTWASPLYYATTRKAGFHGRVWDEIYPELGPGGKFWLDVSKRFGGINWLVSRHGDWTTPWPVAQVPGFEMPEFDPNFSLTFTEVTDRRALEVRDLIRNRDAKIALYYSGGIDSTISLAALLRNLTEEELKNVHVCMSVDSIIENPGFFQKFIYNRMNVLDSSVARYNEVLNQGFIAISCDQGDSLFGTEAALQLYHVQPNLMYHLSVASRNRISTLLEKSSAAELPFSEFADLIQLHFRVEENPEFGRIFYERLVQNIATSSVPVTTLHDFFWWFIFNLKYMHCALRAVISYSGGRDQRFALEQGIINWFHHPDYQRWSMKNNNNGEKIRGSSPTTYKWAGRKYLHEFDKNDWYFRHKLKLQSLGQIIHRSGSTLDNMTIFGMDNNYSILRLTDPAVLSSAKESLQSFQL